MSNLPVTPVFNPPIIGSFIENQSGYRYKIARALKNGAFGSIYLGADIFENLYAVKVFQPLGTYEEVKIMWDNEARTLIPKTLH